MVMIEERERRVSENKRGGSHGNGGEGSDVGGRKETFSMGFGLGKRFVWTWKGVGEVR